MKSKPGPFQARVVLPCRPIFLLPTRPMQHSLHCETKNKSNIYPTFYGS